MAVIPTAPGESFSASAADDLAPASSLSRRLLPFLWGAFWLVMVLVSEQEDFRNPHIRWWEPLTWEGSSCLAATSWVLFERRYRRRHQAYLDQPLAWFWRHVRWLPLVAVTFIPFVYSLRHGVYALAGRVYKHEPWSFVLTYETTKIALFAGLWLGILFGLDSFEQLQQQRRRLLELRKSLAESQLSQLKAQLRPHFLFNALNTISALMHVDVERADRLLARLGDLLRTSLQTHGEEWTSLREELRTLELFSQIMQERFADRVSLTWEVDPVAHGLRVPSMLLQPLLENAFKHGVERSLGPTSIRITACIAEQRLVVAISNTGSTLAANHPDGVGLRNCRERLRVIYGAAASLALLEENQAVVARVTLPAAPFQSERRS